MADRALNYGLRARRCGARVQQICIAKITHLAPSDFGRLIRRLQAQRLVESRGSRLIWINADLRFGSGVKDACRVPDQPLLMCRVMCRVRNL